MPAAVKERLAISHYFEIENIGHQADSRVIQSLFGGCTLVTEPLIHLAERLPAAIERCREGGEEEKEREGGHVCGYTVDETKGPAFIHRTATVFPAAHIEGPCYIGPNATVGHAAYVRSNTAMCENAIVGHSSECKHSILLPHAHAPHFNYVGDSIIGWRVNLGAGTKLSNLPMMSLEDINTQQQQHKTPADVRTVKIRIKPSPGEDCDYVFDTSLVKMGAVLGDGVQTGCNVVCNPGVCVGRGTLVYGGVCLRGGYYAPRQIVKLRQEIEISQRW
ncbi:unnamed protein product [Vitrella brassicaformis CCMP3155]|uniref:Mannose-1-phosphate guanyltransferase C-terminal domain-containing protein n=1 Tax=Vitrella brassicaformis (strain CCMP3155) TaxID=1169540 RepID=A0A0G4GHD9_VITBC|nr:unnamed protein product [Vitrella brassicaformis CCMP3155]|eukprot:CEM29157.1 unnamed protein product [Vitrella brassicaformis CCMP3155]